MSGQLKQMPPPIDSEYYWRKILNLAYGLGEDELFRWLQDVRAYVEAQENERKRGVA